MPGKKHNCFFIILFLILGFNAFSASEEYTLLMEKGKLAEEKFQYIQALSYYYDAMTLEMANGADEAYEAFEFLAEEIKSGFPKLKGFTNAELGWRRIQEEYDSYWILNCPLSFDFSSLQKDRMGYGADYLTYTVSLQSHFSPKYNEIFEIVSKGFQLGKSKNWTNLNLDWPRTANKKTSEFIPGYVKKNKEIFNAATQEPSLYSVDFYITDLNGKSLFSMVTIQNGKTYTFVNPSKAAQKLIDSAQVKIVVSGLHLSYGDITGFNTSYRYNLPDTSIKIADTRFNSPYSHLLHETSSYTNISFRKNIDDYVKMVPVSAGFFSMGSSRGYPREKPVHRVGIKSFEMSSTEVTQILYSKVMGENPSFYKGDLLPVERVSWYDSIYFCNLLSQMTGKVPCYTVDGARNPYEWKYKPHLGLHIEGQIKCDFSASGYRLPTEAEWEYAAVEGEKNSAYRYAGSSTAINVGWVKSNAAGKTHEVGQKLKNALGLYDLTGNVSEWCWDYYGSGYYYDSPDSDPTGPGEGNYRITRGGSIWDDNIYCRVADRSDMNPENNRGVIGIRLVRSIF